MGWLRNFRERMNPRKPAEVARASVEAINSRNWQQLADLLSVDFYFLDGPGYRIDGKDRYLVAIRDLIAEAGDFHLEIDDIEIEDGVVIMRGRSHASSHSHRTAAIWRLLVVDGKIAYLHNFRANSNTRLYKFATKGP